MMAGRWKSANSRNVKEFQKRQRMRASSPRRVDAAPWTTLFANQRKCALFPFSMPNPMNGSYADLRDMIMKRKKIFDLLALLISIVIAALSTEVAVRAFVDDGMQYDLEMWKYALEVKGISSDPLIGHNHRPSRHAFLMGVQFDTNSKGLRDGEFSYEAARQTAHPNAWRFTHCRMGSKIRGDVSEAHRTLVCGSGYSSPSDQYWGW